MVAALVAALEARCVAARGAALWPAISAAYQEQHRSYHTLAHLHHMHAWLDAAEASGIRLHDPAVVRWAVWYHDIVYDPTAKDNEVRSAQLAQQHLAGLLTDDQVADVMGMILATITHQLPQRAQPIDMQGGAVGELAEGSIERHAFGTDCALFLDADLSILGAPETDYLDYVRRIRAEYCHFPDEEFAAGRAKVLQAFLARPVLYFTTYARDELGLEAVARSNVACELAGLLQRQHLCNSADTATG